MISYYTIVAMPLVVAFFMKLTPFGSINSNDQSRRIYIGICAVTMFLVFGLAYHGLGSGDGKWYYSNWKYLSGVQIKKMWKVIDGIDIEKGYLIFAWITSHIFPNPQILHICYGLLLASAFSIFMYENCEDLVLGYMMFYCLGMWSFLIQGIRQGMAMAICLFAVSFCKQRRIVPFILLVLLAMTFHASAIVFFVVIFLPRIELNLKGYIAAVAGIIILTGAVNYLVSFFNIIINDSYKITAELGGGGAVTLLCYFAILVLFLLLLPRDEKLDPDNRLFFYMTLFGFVTFLMRYNILAISERVSFYFMFGQFILLPKVIRRIEPTQAIIAKMIIYLLCFGLMAYKSRTSEIYPFLFCWDV